MVNVAVCSAPDGASTEPPNSVPPNVCRRRPNLDAKRQRLRGDGRHQNLGRRSEYWSLRAGTARRVARAFVRAELRCRIFGHGPTSAGAWRRRDDLVHAGLRLSMRLPAIRMSPESSPKAMHPEAPNTVNCLATSMPAVSVTNQPRANRAGIATIQANHSENLPRRSRP